MTARRLKLAVGALLLATIAAGLILTPNPDALWRQARDHLTEWQQLASDRPVSAVALFFVLYVGVTGLSVPAAMVLSLTAGAIFGRWVGTPLAVTAAASGATVSFLSCRYLFRDWVRERFGRRLAPIESGLTRDGPVYLLTIRLLPVVPYFVVNLAAGLTPMRVRTFFLVSWLGMLPAGFMYVNLGTGAANAERVRDLISAEVMGGLCLLGLLPLAMRWAVRRLRAG